MIRSIIGRNPKRFCQIITAIGIGVSTTASAQMGEGGTPPSFRYQTMLRSEAAVTDIPVTFSVEDMKQVDRWQESEGLAPLCVRSEEHTSELQSPGHLVCRLLLEKKKQERF